MVHVSSYTLGGMCTLLPRNAELLLGKYQKLKKNRAAEDRRSDCG